ncbi:hypothetical protein LTR10_013286 [Elasticomyces elasticus]|uniref:Ubiquitin-like domain-containing protein n=1 Tax=Exophiala sideris TaxID=1016849 RepID=A0ABR0J4V0_9EURO|nr:hypothetical protein LTR10_013286 [Elasticomyces elasticus]KAK5027486.1 hypothetical protein LTS07_007088 [Exophiala sideris]KAK5034810.1 hypothetical protein LTR13_005992 [Exophiala sideris]KAK5056453.1 hypothetical protein LTR69_007994 [Exophiala sideris]KAK5181056.1 hypothetical protein LTR44_006387 [Eurotiomycetes sp. CCFEE 6388]
MAKRIIVYRPIVIDLPEESCKRVGDLVAAIKTPYPHLLDWHDGLEYAVHHDDGEGSIALRGGQYDPNAELLPGHRRPIEVMAKITEAYTIKVCRVSAKDPLGAQGIVEVEVYHQDSFGQLKERIERQIGIPKGSQQLAFMGFPTLDSWILGWQRVFQGCTVILHVAATITYHFKDTTSSITVVLDEPLSMLLGQIATSIGEDISMLRFVFSKTSAEVAANAREWLPDRFQLFKTQNVVGNVAENGLANGDAIRVYRENRKCELDDETVRSSEGGGKRHRPRKRAREAHKKQEAPLPESVST